jgi:hypothetical protein
MDVNGILKKAIIIFSIDATEKYGYVYYGIHTI